MTTLRPRAAGLLLLLSVGVAGAIGYAATTRDGGPASNAGSNQSSGNGTVVAASPSPNAGGDKPGNGPKDGVFSISGQVSGLRPGVPGSLVLTLDNPNNWPIDVQSVLTGVGTPNQSPCPAAALSVADYQFHPGDPVVHIAAHSHVQLPVAIELADSLTLNESGCPNARFPLTFSGTATKVAGR